MRTGEVNKDSNTIFTHIPSKGSPSVLQDKGQNDLALQSVPDQINTPVIDEVTISAEAQMKVNAEKSLADALEKMKAESRELQRQLEDVRKQSEGAADYYKKKLKCLVIAMRIMQGDKVPPEDHRFLAEEEPELYQKAMALRIEKEDAKEHDRISEDEETDSEALEDGEVTPDPDCREFLTTLEEA